MLALLFVVDIDRDCGQARFFCAPSFRLLDAQRSHIFNQQLGDKHPATITEDLAPEYTSPGVVFEMKPIDPILEADCIEIFRCGRLSLNEFLQKVKPSYMNNSR